MTADEIARALATGRWPDGEHPRPLIVVAHPDDETIGMGSRLRLCRHGRILHLTDGAPRDLSFSRAAGFETREGYRDARRRELENALALVGFDGRQATFLDVVDQEAIVHAEETAHTIARLVRDQRSDVVITHPFEGGHPDHDAAALSVWAAVELLKREGETLPVVEMLSYHLEGDQLSTTTFLAPEASRPHVAHLTESERDLKRRMFDCFQSQSAILSLFSLGVEAFRGAPHYDFTRAPHSGPLYYETLGFPIDGAQFRQHATSALQSLGLALGRG